MEPSQAGSSLRSYSCRGRIFLSCAIILTIIACSISQPALACFAGPPESAFVTWDELINRSPRIFLAKVVSKSSDDDITKFSFRVIEDIKGIGKERVSVRGFNPNSKNFQIYTGSQVDALNGWKFRESEWPPDFTEEEFEAAKEVEIAKHRAMTFGDYASEVHHSYDNHSEMNFWWERRTGNAIAHADCGVYGTFLVGSTYLIFWGEAHKKGYELIEADEDRWLVFVRNKVSDPYFDPDINEFVKEYAD